MNRMKRLLLIQSIWESIGGEKGLTAYHKDDWLIAEEYGDEGQCVICIYFKIFGHINDENAATLDKEDFQRVQALTSCRKEV